MAAIKMKTTVKLRAEADCPSHSRADIAIRDLVFAIDEPVERGGTNAGPTPTDTALAALIGCTNVIGHKCARALGVDIGHLEISAVCDFDRRGVLLMEEVDVPFTAIRLEGGNTLVCLTNGNQVVEVSEFVVIGTDDVFAGLAHVLSDPARDVGLRPIIVRRGGREDEM